MLCGGVCGGGLQRGVWRGFTEGCTEGCTKRCMEGCAEGYTEGCAEGQLPLAAIDLVMLIGNFKFEAYFEVIYPFWLVDTARTIKVHNYLSLVTIGCL